MPISQNINEAGWFYHAPAKKRVGVERVEYAAPSQIPGIGFDDPVAYEQEEVRGVMFKESDSKYIQLAKMGGRKDLLSFNPERYSKKKTGDAKGYPRNEWFYLEDNRMEDEEKKKQESWDFLLPEYMVHKGYQPSFDDPTTPPVRSGAPFYTEKQSVMDEGKSATDKTVKIPEVRRPGFGVRNEKPPPTMKNLPPREKPARQTKKDNSFKMPSETDEPTNMSKLLSGGYKQDWHTKRDALECGTQQGRDDKGGNGQGAKESKMNSAASRNTTQSKKNEEEKDMFIMSKFKNVPSKIDSHQRAEVMPMHHHQRK